MRPVTASKMGSASSDLTGPRSDIITLSNNPRRSEDFRITSGEEDTTELRTFRRYQHYTTTRMAMSIFYCCLFLMTSTYNIRKTVAFTPLTSNNLPVFFRTEYTTQQNTPAITQLQMARRNKRTPRDEDDLNRWYEDVDENASPDDIFWEEMERQRLMNQLTDTPPEEPAGTRLSGSTSSASYGMNPGPGMNVAAGNGMMAEMPMSGMSNPLPQSPSPSQQQQQPQKQQVMDKKTAESTLQEFSAFAVKDNWLDDDLAALMDGDGEQLEDFSENTKSLDEQLEEWEQENDSNAWIKSSDEPWDHWGEEYSEEENEGDDVFRFKPQPGGRFC